MRSEDMSAEIVYSLSKIVHSLNEIAYKSNQSTHLMNKIAFSLNETCYSGLRKRPSLGKDVRVQVHDESARQSALALVI